MKKLATHSAFLTVLGTRVLAEPDESAARGGSNNQLIVHRPTISERKLKPAFRPRISASNFLLSLARRPVRRSFSEGGSSAKAAAFTPSAPGRLQSPVHSLRSPISAFQLSTFCFDHPFSPPPTVLRRSPIVVRFPALIRIGISSGFASACYSTTTR